MTCLSLLRPALASTAVLACLATSVVAQEFRIETDVYVGDEEKSVSHTVTLFEKSAVYEFVDEPEQVIVYRRGADENSGQFILLDVGSQRRTDVDVERVEKLMAKLTGWAADQKDSLLKFSANPTFDESFDAETGSLVLANPEWTYRTATVPAEDATVLARFRDFTDRYAALNSMMHNAPPPGPRLALNAALAKHGVVPVEIRRTLDGDEKNVVCARHLFSWRLSREDRTRLDEAQASLANFVKVDNKAFIAAQAAYAEEVIRGQSR